MERPLFGMVIAINYDVPSRSEDSPGRKVESRNVAELMCDADSI